MKLYYLIKLMRPVNLLIIAVSMIALRYLILGPILSSNGIYLVISHLDFAFLILGTLMIAGAGNIINDYFDIRPDRLNKHHTIIVGKEIKRREAMISHAVFSTIGFLISAFVAVKYHIAWMLFFQIIAITLLWLYSASFKKSFLFGNLIVAFLTACIPLMVLSFDVPVILKHEGFSFPYIKASLIPFIEVFYIFISYALFAFLLNLIREIQKDMADMRGDREINARTMPLVLGIPGTRKIVNLISLFTILVLIYIQQSYMADKLSSLYMLVFIITPMIISSIKMKNATKSTQFLKSANYTKWAMAGGLGYLIVFYFMFINHFMF